MPNAIAVLAVLAFTSVLVAGYFYMQWTKSRESAAGEGSQTQTREGSNVA